MRVPLARPDDAGWKELIELAREGAAFANGLIADWWVKEYDGTIGDGMTPYRRFKRRLAASVRDSIRQEATAVWRRCRTRVLRQDQRLPAFAADRSLSVRGRAVQLTANGDTWSLSFRLLGTEHGPPHHFDVWEPALRRDWYLRSRLMAIAEGRSHLGKLILSLDPRTRRVFALIAYTLPAVAHSGGAHTATLSMHEDGTLLLRTPQATRDFTHALWCIRDKKKDYTGMVKRVRASVGRGPRWRQRYRRALPDTYSEWARSALHQLSAAMIEWCRRQGAGELTILPLFGEDWPARQFTDMLRYKADGAGIVVSADAPANQPDTARALAATVRKRARQDARTRAALQTLGERLATKGEGN